MEEFGYENKISLNRKSPKTETGPHLVENGIDHRPVASAGSRLQN